MSAPMNWTNDVQDGSLLKNHALSSEIMYHAAKEFKFVPFTRKVDSFGAGKGQTINIMQIKSLATPANLGRLSENRRIPIDKLQWSTTGITAVEWGRGVEYSNLLQQLSHWNPHSEIQRALKEQMTECQDAAAAEAFKATKIVCTPTAASTLAWGSNGVATDTATVNIGLDHLELIRDYLVKDLLCPEYAGGHYIGLFSTKAMRGIKKGLAEWSKYLREGDLVYKSEVGMAENIRFIEITNEAALANYADAGSKCGTGVIFGADPVGRAEVEMPHLLADPNYQSDFGRIKAVAWYGIVAYGLKWPSPNARECRVIRLGSL